MKRIPVLLLLLASSHAALADSFALIPTNYSGPGAFGSRWGTIVALVNHSSEPIVSPGVTFGLTLCGFEGCVSDQVPPGAFAGVIKPQSPIGLLLYLPGEASDIAFVARTAAAPRNALGGGTQLPIARQKDFTRGNMRFPDVPIQTVSAPIRTALRVYSPDTDQGIGVRVELRPWSSPTGDINSFSRVFTLQPASSPPGATDPRPLFPAYVQSILGDDFPGARAIGVSYDVTVVPLPLPSGQIPRIWAFITLTENVTQEVTVQTAQ